MSTGRGVIRRSGTGDRGPCRVPKRPMTMSAALRQRLAQRQRAARDNRTSICGNPDRPSVSCPSKADSWPETDRGPGPGHHRRKPPPPPKSKEIAPKPRLGRPARPNRRVEIGLENPGSLVEVTSRSRKIRKFWSNRCRSGKSGNCGLTKCRSGKSGQINYSRLQVWKIPKIL